MINFFKKRLGTQKSEAAPEGSKAKKRSVPIVRYMVYLLVVTVIVTGVSLSRYTSNLASSDNARVAKLNVTVVPKSAAPDNWANGNVTEVPNFGDARVYNFLVTNNSEVAIRARVYIVSTTNPTGDQATVTSGWSNFAANGGAGYVSATVYGIVGDTVVTMYVEYEQAD